jgi:hypothetical protein
MTPRRTLWLVLAAALGGAAAGGADDKSPAEPKSPEPVARLFVQDLTTCSLKWVAVRVGPDEKLALDPLAAVDGFKPLEPARQRPVQVPEPGSLVCNGVRDDEDGGFESGWVLVQSGVGYTDHGDHGHWPYKKKPAVADSTPFITGREAPALVALDAEPTPVTIPLAARKGTRPVTPEVVTAPDCKAYAFVIHDRVQDAHAEDALEIVALDPNGDGSPADAKSLRTLKVGRSAVEGHFDIAFDAARKHAFFTNPCDGTISALSLKALEVVATFPVGGTPAALVVRGGEDPDD